MINAAFDQLFPFHLDRSSWVVCASTWLYIQPAGSDPRPIGKGAVFGQQHTSSTRMSWCVSRVDWKEWWGVYWYASSYHVIVCLYQDLFKKYLSTWHDYVLSVRNSVFSACKIALPCKNCHFTLQDVALRYLCTLLNDCCYPGIRLYIFCKMALCYSGARLERYLQNGAFIRMPGFTHRPSV